MDNVVDFPQRRQNVLRDLEVSVRHALLDKLLRELTVTVHRHLQAGMAGEGLHSLGC